ncbi:hypothetical protein J4437_05705 [Candidatus Woesearchaeota archaeon]|nr:hypothetical protein [Candidatus Woesearchaeota archaeon]
MKFNKKKSLKKGDLSLSVTAIVVIVIGFVVLALALVFTSNVFDFGGDNLDDLDDKLKFEDRATADNPLTIPKTLTLKRNEVKTTTIDYYNKNEGTAYGAALKVKSCLSSKRTKVEETELPLFTSIPKDVDASESSEFSVIITEKGLTAETYTCSLVVTCEQTAVPAGITCPAKNYEEKTFFLEIKA